MNLTTERLKDIVVIRVKESRMMYPLLSDFSATTSEFIASGTRKFLIDLASVGYIDSATIGCFMDLYRQVSALGGAVKLCCVQKRVETMLTMTGAQNFVEVHADEQAAVKAFEGVDAND